mmetsp:Transcript_22919/g.58942  ORF Transcript_22919/g.58942 Transcript_22919/m.58942 type:complete len:165 (+) Transcript_22919:116-610(+)
MTAVARLQVERKSWRKDHPIGFVAKPAMRNDGSADLLTWHCRIPGKKNTIWEGGVYPVKLRFSDDYPTRPPVCSFEAAGFLHPNVYDDGKICLDIINDPAAGGSWKPTISLKTILLGIQELLDAPNINSAAQQRGYDLFKYDKAQYVRRVKEQAQRFAPTDGDC